MLKSAKPVMTLNQFMVRGQVIKQYRDFLKTAKRLPDENAKKVISLFYIQGIFNCNSGCWLLNKENQY